MSCTVWTQVIRKQFLFVQNHPLLYGSFRFANHKILRSFYNTLVVVPFRIQNFSKNTTTSLSRWSPRQFRGLAINQFSVQNECTRLQNHRCPNGRIKICQVIAVTLYLHFVVRVNYSKVWWAMTILWNICWFMLRPRTMTDHRTIKHKGSLNGNHWKLVL